MPVENERAKRLGFFAIEVKDNARKQRKVVASGDRAWHDDGAISPLPKAPNLMPSSRRSRSEYSISVKVRLDPVLWALFCDQVWDPSLRRPRYGEVSKEFNLMLDRWLKERGVRTHD